MKCKNQSQPGSHCVHIRLAQSLKQTGWQGTSASWEFMAPALLARRSLATASAACWLESCLAVLGRGSKLRWARADLCWQHGAAQWHPTGRAPAPARTCKLQREDSDKMQLDTTALSWSTHLSASVRNFASTNESCISPDSLEQRDRQWQQSDGTTLRLHLRLLSTPITSLLTSLVFALGFLKVAKTQNQFSAAVWPAKAFAKLALHGLFGPAWTRT